MQASEGRILAAFASVADSNDCAFVLSDKLRILRTNAGWTRFALANGGADMLAVWGVGSAILDAVPPPIREHHRQGFASAFAAGQPWELDYECSSAGEYREFRMTAMSAGGRFMLVTHALRVARPHVRAGRFASDAAYLQDALILMCMYCRQVKHRATGSWHWVPAYVAALPSNVSHGLCPRCAELHAFD